MIIESGGNGAIGNNNNSRLFLESFSARDSDMMLDDKELMEM